MGTKAFATVCKTDSIKQCTKFARSKENLATLSKPCPRAGDICMPNPTKQSPCVIDPCHMIQHANETDDMFEYVIASDSKLSCRKKTDHPTPAPPAPPATKTC